MVAKLSLVQIAAGKRLSLVMRALHLVEYALNSFVALHSCGWRMLSKRLKW